MSPRPAERVALAAGAAHALPEPLLLTGRAENHLRGVEDLDDTIARLLAYRDAGADALYAPGSHGLGGGAARRRHSTSRERSRPARDAARGVRGVTRLSIMLFTDPACPFAFSAEPVRQRLRWHYGDQLSWHPRMIVLTDEPGEAEKLAEGAPNLQRTYGMPIDPSPYPRPASSEPACRAVVATRINAPTLTEPLLRRLRVRTMAGGLLDHPTLLAVAAEDVGLEPAQLEAWSASSEAEAELRADMAAARSPSPAARALDHKLGGPRERRRYTAPSYELASSSGRRVATVPGFNPLEAYETAIANVAPALVRRPRPDSVEEVLVWATEPLATAEVAAVAELDLEEARSRLAQVARPLASGADFYWALC